MKNKEYNILIVDDHPIMREGISQIINHQKDFTVIAEAESGPEALNILSEISPDIAIVDISLKGMSGLELTKEIKRRYNTIPVLILSMHPENFYAERSIKAGAFGYIQKNEPSEKVLNAIRKVLAGKIYLSETMSEKMLFQLTGKKENNTTSLVEKLSDREFEAFRLIGEGLKPHQIAEKLFVSVKTIETYYSRIKKKLNLKNASELRQFAINWFREK
ncbi:MAG: response regulator transcription factor [Acidobacteriota bacterium]